MKGSLGITWYRYLFGCLKEYPRLFFNNFEAHDFVSIFVIFLWPNPWRINGTNGNSGLLFAMNSFSCKACLGLPEPWGIATIPVFFERRRFGMRASFLSDFPRSYWTISRLRMRQHCAIPNALDRTRCLACLQLENLNNWKRECAKHVGIC